MDKLFDLNDEQMQLTKSLASLIQDEIGDTYIPFSSYMNLALYHKQYGYYNNLLYKFGSRGDYVTSSLISELFGLSLSRQIQEILSRDVQANILEFGAGNGQLMLDILANMGEQIEHYYIIELSSSLASLQQHRLTDEMPEFKGKVIWLTGLPEDFNGIVIGNEVLDAIACDVVHWHAGNIYSKVVTYQNGRFIFADASPSEAVLEVVNNLPVPTDDYVSEISLERAGFIKSLSESMARGVILLIDYGYGQSEYYSAHKSSGTLRGFFRQHLLDDVLLYPGLIDITSSVDFSSIARTGIANGLDLLGFTNQASFLINCGILDELEQKKQGGLSDAKYLQLTNQLNRLISPNEMGEVFKVIAFSKNMDYSDYVGLSSGDRTYTL